MLETIKQAIVDALKQVGVNILGGVKSVAKGGFLALIPASYWVCLGVSLISVILYIYGDKKKGKFIGISVVVYTLLEAIGSAIK